VEVLLVLNPQFLSMGGVLLIAASIGGWSWLEANRDQLVSPQLITPPVPSRVAFQQFFADPSPAMLRYQPRREFAWANRNNFGDRLLRDPRRRLVAYAPLIVLHETNYSADSALSWFSLSELSDEQQASYHAIIRRDGTVIQVVPTDKKAYGAADSAFRRGPHLETIYGRGGMPSVNSFTYHISFETPLDGQNNAPTHSGYTPEQYRSLAWLVALTRVPNERITTHKAVDLSGERMDPRSFEPEVLLREVNYFRQQQAIGHTEQASR
jgi:hypothetical protein